MNRNTVPIVLVIVILTFAIVSMFSQFLQSKAPSTESQSAFIITEDGSIIVFGGGGGKESIHIIGAGLPAGCTCNEWYSPIPCGTLSNSEVCIGKITCVTAGVPVGYCAQTYYEPQHCKMLEQWGGKPEIRWCDCNGELWQDERYVSDSCWTEKCKEETAMAERSGCTKEHPCVNSCKPDTGGGPVCGNGNCESGESCSNCQPDCGSCPTTTTGSTTTTSGTVTTSGTTSSSTTTTGTAGTFTASNFKCSMIENKYRCSIDYNNGLDEKAVVLFTFANDNNGKVVSSSAPETNTGSGTVSGLFFCDTFGSGAYKVSWAAYRSSDSSLSNVIAFGGERIKITC